MIERSQVELLAPAGDEECFKAAIAAGADAVYFGMEQFSARTRAKNITVKQAEYLIPLAHENNCRAYLTLNTLITDKEMQQAVSLVEKAVACGIDAVIVQDLGVLKVIKKYFPNLEIHASTQMTTHNVSQCQFLSELGVSQVNLSRELSLPEIQKITELLHKKNIVPEIFVQGAYCISYSGQCYLSGYLYNQAGNRGDCVQPCRRTWCSQAKENVDQKEYKALFHLKDNSAFPLADKLIRENVPLSLKIEGRIKNAEYVWAVTSAWREQIDLILAEKEIMKKSAKLTGAINRDYTCGYLEGNINSGMFSSGAKDISQIKAGTVKNYIADSKTLILQKGDGLLQKGDRLTIKNSNNQFICTANVTGKNESGYTIQITNKITKKILGGQIVYKSTSVINEEELSKILKKFGTEKTEKSCSENSDEKNYKVEISVKALENEPIEISYKSQGQKVTVKSEKVLVKAEKAGLTFETLEEKLTKLGGTGFSVGAFSVEKLDPEIFIPLGELNSLRRKAVELLAKKISESSETEQQKQKVKKEIVLEKPGKNLVKPVSQTKAYLVDNKKVLDEILCERSVSKEKFKIIYEIPSAVNVISEEIKELLKNEKEIVLYFNSILLDKDLENTLDFIKTFDNLKEREIICENTGLAFELKKLGCKIILGANCNIYNSWNIQEYAENLNLKGVILSLELQPKDLNEIVFPENLEIWYPEKMYRLLMQSRQCLVKNGSGCSKNCVDRNCIETCSKKYIVQGMQNEKILAVKRPGFYSALYTAEKIPVPSEVLKEKVSVWIIDKRKF